MATLPRCIAGEGGPAPQRLRGRPVARDVASGPSPNLVFVPPSVLPGVEDQPELRKTPPSPLAPRARQKGCRATWTARPRQPLGLPSESTSTPQSESNEGV